MKHKTNSSSNIKQKINENFKAITFALIAALTIRTFAFEPFKIPSSSMEPTLLIGDYLFVSKFSYGYSNIASFFGFNIIDKNTRIFTSNSHMPRRGDVTVFKLPSNPKVNYIKRIMAIPGDKIQIKNQVVYINDKPLKKEMQGVFFNEKGERFNKYKETTLSGKTYNTLEYIENELYDNTEEFYVPEGHYFVMGDNRDRSADSRTPQISYPFVPFENLVGRAEVLFFSINNNDKSNKTSIFGVKLNRLFNLINKERI
ncbi:MAG: signal peptidase I [Alphaproteobacteria bacterium]|jgi:signal peptidase I|nr:signal peptidase I [Alphaproteobacteria bacterium]